MRISKTLRLLLCICIGLLLAGGCDELKNCKLQNDTYRQQIVELQSQAKVTALRLDQMKRSLVTAKGLSTTEMDALKQKIAALEEGLAKKKALISSMQKQLIAGGIALPVELNTMLEDFAKSQNQMVTYDSTRGILKFKSDLLFEPGSDKVAPSAAEAVTTLCGILNSEQGGKFDIIIAGHTDDMRIAKPATRQVHPTNWHLSAHRAISVLDVMAKNSVVPERLSMRGFGEFRPIEENRPNKKGNPKNRRVEIYIVPKGT